MSILFNGTNQRLNLNSLVIPGEFSMSFWLRINSSAGVQRILGSNGNFEVRTDGAASPTLAADIFGNGVAGSQALTVGQWYHIVILGSEPLDANQIYINGVLDSTTTGATDTVTGPVLSLGGTYGNAAELANVNFADFRVYNRIISPEEILSIYNSRGHDGIVSGLLTRLLFNENPAGQIIDPFIAQQSNSIGSSTSLTINTPTNTDGNLLVAVISATAGGLGAPGPTVTAPAGWTLANSGNSALPDTASTPSVWVFYRTASSEPASRIFTASTGSTIVGTIMSFKNEGFSSNIPQIVPSAINTGNNANPISPSITANERSLVLRIMACDAQEVTAPGVYPADTTGRFAGQATGEGNGLSLAVATQVLPAGATGTAIWTINATEQWGALTVNFNGQSIPGRDISGNSNGGNPINDPVFDIDVLSFRRKNRG